MRIDPALDRLVAASTPLAEMQKDMDRAREQLGRNPLWRAVARGLEDYGKGADLAECGDLAALFRCLGVARSFVDIIVERFLPALAVAPLSQFPFRHSGDVQMSTMLLGRSGRALLVLAAREPGQSDARTVDFSGGVRHDVVLAGEAEARVVRRDVRAHGSLRMEASPLPLQRGSRFSVDIARECVVLDRVSRRLVSLRLLRVAEPPAVLRRYRLPDGRLLRQASGDIGESRQELMLALLGRMKRADAAPVMAQMTGEGSDHLRWEALRECLALDTVQGFATLTSIAGDAQDSLARSAAALRLQLLARWPQLQRLDEAPCPA